MGEEPYPKKARSGEPGGVEELLDSPDTDSDRGFPEPMDIACSAVTAEWVSMEASLLVKNFDGLVPLPEGKVGKRNRDIRVVMTARDFLDAWRTLDVSRAMDDGVFVVRMGERSSHKMFGSDGVVGRCSWEGFGGETLLRAVEFHVAVPAEMRRFAARQCSRHRGEGAGGAHAVHSALLRRVLELEKLAQLSSRPHEYAAGLLVERPLESWLDMPIVVWLLKQKARGDAAQVSVV